MSLTPPPRARVLKQAYNLKEGLPDQLDERTMAVRDYSKFFQQEIDRLRMQVTDARKRRALAEQRRQVKREECERNERGYRTQVTRWKERETDGKLWLQETVLRERQDELDRLALEEAGQRCRECSGSSLRDYYRVAVKVRIILPSSSLESPQVPQRSSYSPPAVVAQELALEAIQLGTVSLAAPRQVEMEELAVRVRSEFHTK